MTAPVQYVPVPVRTKRIDPRKAMIISALCWTGFAIVAWLVIIGRTEMIDRAGLIFWRGSELQPRGSYRVLEGVRDLTALGGVLLRHLAALGAIAALLFLRLRREAVILFLTVTGGWLANSMSKWVVGRDRPDIVPHLMEAGGASFPSGHSFNAAVVYIAIALAFAAFSNRQPVRLTIIGSAVALSLAVAWSRVWLGVHFPTDVVAGWLGGAGWAFLACALFHRPATIAARHTPP